MEVLQIFRTFHSKVSDFTTWIGKRSGCPEQWSKIGEKYDNIRKIQPFLGNLERFGEIWIGIWINC